MTIEPALLGEIFERLREEGRARPRRFPPPELDSILRRGWAYMSQVEDYLVHYDGRLINFPLERILPLWDLQIELVASRPKYVTSPCMLMRAMPVASLASFAISLERIGFEVDPTPLVQPLRESLSQRVLVTHCELDVLAYEATRNRYQMEFTASGVEARNPWEERMLRTGRGIRVKLISCAGTPFRLEARSTAYRAPQRSRFVTCEYCGHQYTSGDLQSRDDHRTQHARVRRVVDPTPKREFISRLAGSENPEVVRTIDPIWMHREVYERAVRFKRDFGYDFIQWDGTDSRKCTDPRWEGHLFGADIDGAPEGIIAGACAFYRNDSEERWEMMWVWVAPRYRRAGIMARRWNSFVDRYGDFGLATPFSQAMHAFLLCHGTPRQRDLATQAGFSTG